MPLASRTGLKFSLLRVRRAAVWIPEGDRWYAGLSLQQNVANRTSLELCASEGRVPLSGFRVHSAALKIRHQFDVPVVTAAAIPWGDLRDFDAQRQRVRVANQTYFKADERWGNQYRDWAVSNRGVQLDYFLIRDWFVTGEGQAAYADEAGAYMTGQLVVGRRWPATDRWFVESELMAGAAGGGGLEVGVGLVALANATLGYHLNEAISVLRSAGRNQAMHGKFKANVVALSLAHQFTTFAK